MKAAMKQIADVAQTLLDIAVNAKIYINKAPMLNPEFENFLNIHSRCNHKQ